MPLRVGKYGSVLAAALASDSKHTMDLIRYLIEEAHADASILSTNPPRKMACHPESWETWRNEISEYLIEGNYVVRDVLMKIGFEEQELSSEKGSVSTESTIDFYDTYSDDTSTDSLDGA